MQELRFLHSACCLILVDICIMIHEESLMCFEVIERTRLRRRFGDGESSKGNNSKSINTRAMVLALCWLIFV